MTLPALARLGVRRLDAAVVTHPDVDHCRGIADLASYLPIDRIWTGPGGGSSRCSRELAALPGARWRKLGAGERARVGGLAFEVLYPGPGRDDPGNAASLVLRVEGGARSLLLTGDLEARGEGRLVRRIGPARLDSDILKVAHHGSATSSTGAFLSAVRPTVALISAGRRNRYGHPSEKVLRRLAAQGVRVLRTDRDGMVRLALEPGPGARRRGRRLP